MQNSRLKTQVDDEGIFSYFRFDDEDGNTVTHAVYTKGPLDVDGHVMIPEAPCEF